MKKVRKRKIFSLILSINLIFNNSIVLADTGTAIEPQIIGIAYNMDGTYATDGHVEVYRQGEDSLLTSERR